MVISLQTHVVDLVVLFFRDLPRRIQKIVHRRIFCSLLVGMAAEEWGGNFGAFVRNQLQILLDSKNDHYSHCGWRVLSQEIKRYGYETKDNYRIDKILQEKKMIANEGRIHV